MTEIDFKKSKKDTEEKTYDSDYKHLDYDQNLREVEYFISKVEPELLEGMSLAIGEVKDLKKSLLWISWNSGNQRQVGNYAYPINLHQNNSKLKKEIYEVFNSTYILAKKWGCKKIEKKEDGKLPLSKD